MNESHRSTLATPRRSESLKLLHEGGDSTPLYCFPGLGGYVTAFMPLVVALGKERSIYGIQAQGLNAGQCPHDRIEAMAASALEAIRQVKGQGPYLLAGWSLGGIIALEAARQLGALGQQTDLVAMFDTWLSIEDSAVEALDDQPVMQWIAPNVRLTVTELKNLPLGKRWARIAERASRLTGEVAAEIARLAETCTAQLEAAKCYEPKPYDGRVALFRAAKTRTLLEPRWQSLYPHLEVEIVPGDHYSMLRRPDVNVLADRLRHCLDREGCGENSGKAETDGKTVGG